MPRVSRLACVVLAVASVVIGLTTVVAQELPQSPTYYLCAENVAEVSARESGGQFLITVRLTEAATKQWTAFTIEYVARHVRVMVASVLLVEAEVRTPITSGLIEIARPDSASAEELRQAIEGAPEEPCGSGLAD
jgi:preprotein translocase subunit SecD